MEQSKQLHSITIDNRKSGLISGVEKVISSNDKILQLVTTQGAITINGSDFKIKKFSIEDGELSFEGVVDTVKYVAINNNNKSVIKKLFR